jgi:hypothetical protein
MWAACNRLGSPIYPSWSTDTIKKQSGGRKPRIRFPTVTADSVRRIPLSFLLLATITSYGFSQQAGQSVRGVVRDTAGAPLGGVDVFLGPRQTTTNAQGLFRVDSLRPGQYVIMIRLVGYSPIRSRVTVAAAGPTALEYVLVPAPVMLPNIVVEGHRTGIYGTVGDPSLHAAVGARVQVLGAQGGEALTDSLGRFAFPNADRGAYLVRVTFPGYYERRMTLELTRGEGRELAVVLSPGSRAGAAPTLGP